MNKPYIRYGEVPSPAWHVRHFSDIIISTIQSLHALNLQNQLKRFKHQQHQPIQKISSFSYYSYSSSQNTSLWSKSSSRLKSNFSPRFKIQYNRIENENRKYEQNFKKSCNIRFLQIDEMIQKLVKQKFQICEYQQLQIMKYILQRLQMQNISQKLEKVNYALKQK